MVETATEAVTAGIVTVTLLEVHVLTGIKGIIRKIDGVLPDWFFKAFWTGVSVFVGQVAVEIASAPQWYIVWAAPVVNWVHSKVRERTGGVPATG